MTHRFADITFTDSVKAAQEHNGSRAQNERYQSRFGPNDQLGSRETDFIAQRDTFYLATVSETGWPYVQHRGGTARILAGDGTDSNGLRRFRWQHAVSVRRQCQQKRSLLDNPDGLPKTPTPENFGSHACRRRRISGRSNTGSCRTP